MKIWLFASLQALIALLGLAAYFLADNWMLATAAAVTAALLGAAQPLIAARKSQRLEAYQDAQYQKSLEQVGVQIDELAEQTIDPPPPHRATLAVLLRRDFGELAEDLLDRYDQVLQTIATGGPESEEMAADIGESIGNSAIASHLRGLAQLATGDIEAALASFSSAVEQQPGWIAPWLGWASAAYRQRRWDEIVSQHPHVNGVELLPYDAGDQETFLALNEQQREELTDGFQRAAIALGNYYTMAELSRSCVQIAASREGFQKAA